MTTSPQSGSQQVQVKPILVMIGPPGVGKGTQAVALSRHYGIAHLSSGDVLSGFLKKENPSAADQDIATRISQIISAGNLVPDDLVTKVMESRISQPDCAAGFILDGYPRTVAQAETIASLLMARGFVDPALIVISIEMDPEQLIKRLAGRFICSSCKRSYNTETMMPKTPGRCDSCQGESFVKRPDDQEEVVRHRIGVYNRETKSVMDYYAGWDRMIHVDGASGDSQAIFAMIRGRVDEFLSLLDSN